MSDLRETELVKSARFKYGSQRDLVKLVGSLDPFNIELSLTYMANTSDRFRDLFSKMEGSGKWVLDVDADYSERTLPNMDFNKTLSPEDITEILPEGIKRFIGDLDELIELSEQEKVAPLLRALKREDNNPQLEIVSIQAPKIEIQGAKRYQEIPIQEKIEDNLYAPRLERLSSVGLLARGYKPQVTTFSMIRRNALVVREAFRALETVPEENIISSFRIGANPQDEGNREFYHWVCQSEMYTSLRSDHTLTMLFDQEVDPQKIETDLRNRGIEIILIKN